MVRPFTAKDLNAIAEIWLKTNIAAHDFIDESYWNSNFSAVKQQLGSAEIFVFEENRIVKGFVGMLDEYIAGIFVVADFQSKGVGKALLNFIKEQKPSLNLQVYKKNIKATNFYVREGFSISNEQIDENTGETELVMNWKKER